MVARFCSACSLRRGVNGCAVLRRRRPLFVLDRCRRARRPHRMVFCAAKIAFAEPQGSSPLARSIGATSGQARNRSNRFASSGFVVPAMRPAGEHRRRLQVARNSSHHLDAVDLLQLADLLNRQIGLAGHELLGGEALLDDDGFCIDVGGDAELLDQLCEQDAAGAEPRIGDGARAEQRGTQRCLGCDIGTWRARLDGDTDERARQVDTSCRRRRAPRARPRPAPRGSGSRRRPPHRRAAGSTAPMSAQNRRRYARRRRLDTGRPERARHLSTPASTAHGGSRSYAAIPDASA